MNNLADTAFRAGRLFHYAMLIRERPGMQNPEYAQLIEDYQAQPDLRVIFDQFADACFLEVLEVSAAGVFLAPKAGGRKQSSAFCFRLSDYGAFEDVRERVLQGVIQLAIAAFVFPTTERLHDALDAPGPVVRVPQLVEHLDALLGRFRDAATELPSDDEAAEPIWRQLRLLVPELPTRAGRQSRHSLTGQVQLACKVLEREGFFRRIEDRPGDPEKYIPLPQYRVHVRQLADHRRLYEFIARLKGGEAHA